MRILYFSRDYTPHDFRFLSALAETNHHVGYLRLEDRGQRLENRPLPENIEVLPWAGGAKPARLKDGLRLLAGLKKVIRTFRPDLIHAGPIQSAAFLSALAGSHPLVTMTWGYDLLIDSDRNPLWNWVTRYTLHRSAALVADSEILRQQAIADGMRPERIVTFPWGVDLEHFSPSTDAHLRQNYGWGAKEVVLLSTRGWAPMYGSEELATGFARAARLRPELRLLMLGSGHLENRLKEIFSDHNVLDLIVFPGQVHYELLPNYYQAADLYLSASHSDGSSISLLEAMACGLPALVSDIPGNREWITPGEQGWWFSTGDAGDLAEKILQAVEQRDKFRQMGASARQIAEQRADWSKNFPKLLEAYHLAITQ
jgi:glycosyltransferase involved in cell wall biosynthesis